MKIKLLTFILSGFMSAGVCHAVDAYYIDLKCVTPVKIVQADKAFDVTFKVKNMKPSDEVTSFDVVFTPEGGTPMSRKVTLSQALNAVGLDITVSGFVCDIKGADIPYTFTVSGVNGTDAEQKGYGDSGTLVSANRVYTPTFYVEEGTGTWCPYCYEAFLGMEHMAENYGDAGFNGVAIHYNDEFSSQYPSSTFSSFLDRISGYPTAVYNRNFKNRVTSPSLSGFLGAYQTAMSTPSLYDISLSFDTPAGKTLDVTVEARFGVDMENKGYALSYMLTESGFEGMQKTPSSYASVIYNDIARGGSVYNGVPFDEVPSPALTGEIYSTTAKIDLSYLQSLSNSAITVLLLDADTGMVLASRRYPLNEPGLGVDRVFEEEDAREEYYNLQGVRVENPTHGLYVCRRGSKTSKVFVK